MTWYSPKLTIFVVILFPIVAMLGRLLDALEKMYPDFSRSDVETFRVTRTRNVMAIPKLRYSESLPPMKTSVEGLYLINSSYILKGNLNVNETIGIAEEAYEKYLAGELAATGALASTA